MADAIAPAMPNLAAKLLASRFIINCYSNYSKHYSAV